MPGRRRTTAERARDRRAIADLYLHGYLQVEIAERLGISQQTVSIDVRALHKQWEEQAVDDHAKLIQVTLAKIDWLEQQAYEQWVLSLKGTSRTVLHSAADEGGDPQVVKATTYDNEDEGRGDPAWWDRMAQMAALRLKTIESGRPLRMEVGEPGTDWEAKAAENRRQWELLKVQEEQG